MEKEILAEDYINQKKSELLKESESVDDIVDIRKFSSSIGDITVHFNKNNLVIALDDVAELEELWNEKKDKMSDEQFFISEILEGSSTGGMLGNGFSLVAPEDIGALTDSLILEYDGEYYWFPNYQVESYIEKLIDAKEIVFDKGDDVVKESVKKDLTEKRHRARLIDPSEFKNFRTDKDKGGKGVDFVYGIRKKKGERGGKTELQGITFDSEEFSVKQAKMWLKRNKKDAKFTPSSVKESVKTYENLFVEKANRFMDEKFLVEDIENFEDEYVEEAQEDDAFITDNTRGGYDTSCSGKFLGNFREYDDAVIAIGDCMKDSNWFPNVWNVNERGSMDLITDFDATYKKALEDRAQVKAEDEIEYDLEKSYEEE